MHSDLSHLAMGNIFGYEYAPLNIIFYVFYIQITNVLKYSNVQNDV